MNDKEQASDMPDANDGMDECNVVMHMPAQEVNRLFEFAIEPGDNSEYIIPVGFDDLSVLLDHIHEMKPRMANMDSLARDCPECVEDMNLENIEESLEEAIDILIHTANMIERLNRGYTRNHNMAWLLRKCRERLGDPLPSLSLRDIGVPTAILKKLGKHATTLSGLEIACAKENQLIDMGMTIGDIESIKSYLRTLIRGLRVQKEPPLTLPESSSQSNEPTGDSNETDC